MRSIPVTQWRGYDPSLGRFAQADTIVPTQTQGIQAWDRYAYVNNDPIRNTDPTGHLCEDEDLDGHCPGYTPVSTSTTTTICVDGGWCYPQYTTWNLLRLGSPCTACHVTHWTGTIPKNGEIDYDLVRYYRSMDKFAITFHTYAFAYVGYAASEAAYLSSFGNKGYIVVTEKAYETYGTRWGQHSGQVFVTDEEGLAMVMQQDSVEGVNQVLGTNFPADSALRVVEIDNIWSYNLQIPTSGNEYWIPGGYTIGGAPERIIAHWISAIFQVFPYCSNNSRRDLGCQKTTYGCSSNLADWRILLWGEASTKATAPKKMRRAGIRL